MSFGWSAGDILAAISLLVEIGQALNGADGSAEDHKRASDFVTPITKGLLQLHEYASEDEEGISHFDENKVSAFRPIVQALEPLINQFKDKVLEYSGLHQEDRRKRDWFKRQFDKLTWHFVEQEKLLNLRQAIQAHFEVLGALYPKMIIAAIEFSESKSAERDADILNGVNSNTKGINDIYNLVKQIWSLQQMSAGILLTLGPDEGVIVTSASNADNDPTTSGIAAALLLVEPRVQPRMTDEFAADAKNIKVDGKIIRKLGAWLSDQSLSRLWLYGDKSTLVSAIVFNTARKRSRAAVAYPCRHLDHNGNPMTQENLLVGLVYSFIYQFLQQLPANTVLDGWNSDEQFAVLDGTFDSVSRAIELIGTIIRLVPNYVCIIDGLELLGHTEDPTIRNKLVSLRNVFQSQDDRCGRLLLTSSGPNPLLVGWVTETGVLDQLDVSGNIGSGRFSLSKELMSVAW